MSYIKYSLYKKIEIINTVYVKFKTKNKMNYISLFRNLKPCEIDEFKEYIKKLEDYESTIYIHDIPFQKYKIEYDVDNKYTFVSIKTNDENHYFNLLLNDNYLMLRNNLNLQTLGYYKEDVFKKRVQKIVKDLNDLFPSLFYIN